MKPKERRRNKALLKRYGRARRVTRDLANAILESQADRRTILRCANLLGLRQGNEIVAASETEMDVLQDFIVYSDLRGRRNAAARYLRLAGAELTEEQRMLLEAMSGAHYSIREITAAEPGFCVHMSDLISDRLDLVIDRGFSETATLGMLVGVRLIDLGDFAMTTGAALPASADILDTYLRRIPSKLADRIEQGGFQLPPADQIVLQRMVVSWALSSGASEHIAYA